MRRASLVVGAVLVGLVLMVSLVGLVWTPYDPARVVPGDRLLSPSATHWLGTDAFGIDILSRIMAGARSVLLVGVFAVGIAALVGVPLGIVAGMNSGWLGRVVVRATDVLYAFPAVLLAILFAGALGSSTTTAMLAIGIATIPVFTRIARAGVLQVMSQDFITASRVSGIGWLRIAWRHVLPNIAPLIGVQASVSFALAILAEAALSYLGLATPPEVPTWGRMLYDAQRHLLNDPHLAIAPAVAIAGAVLGFNLLGDGLRDLLDPRLKEVAE
ncbi:ABC transporter permease [Aestuariimicrobium ganziense]|uniref:ABC transporter permease n=1 Tax=Aestuariimicrobium ganziense TaxID=2773677 RepID=UPI001942E9E8|nr:ABC transporter permease [Aestuariimicrobium ganziense]